MPTAYAAHRQSCGLEDGGQKLQHTQQHVRLLPLPRGSKRSHEQHQRLQGVDRWLVRVDLEPRLGSKVLAETNGGLVAAWVRGVSGRNGVDGVNQVARHLVQLQALAQSGLVKQVEGLVVEAGEVDVEEGVGVDVEGLLAGWVRC